MISFWHCPINCHTKLTYLHDFRACHKHVWGILRRGRRRHFTTECKKQEKESITVHDTVQWCRTLTMNVKSVMAGEYTAPPMVGSKVKWLSCPHAMAYTKRSFVQWRKVASVGSISSKLCRVTWNDWRKLFAQLCAVQQMFSNAIRLTDNYSTISPCWTEYWSVLSKY